MNCSNPSLLIDTANLVPVDGQSKKAMSGMTKTVVQVHPLVLLAVLDHHTRRQEGASRVIGTLLGQRSTDGNACTVIHVTNCFAVPHAEHGEEVAIGKDFNRQMLALHTRAHRKDVVIGWYATALPPSESEASSSLLLSGSTDKNRFRCIADTSSLIHDFYAGEASAASLSIGTHGAAVSDIEPIHLLVDTSLTYDTIGIKAYRSAQVTILGEPFANLFHEIPVCLKTTESERICIDKMIEGLGSLESADETTDKTNLDVLGDSQGVKALQLSMSRLLELIDTVADYVDNILQGNIPKNADQIGIQLYDALSTVPRVREEKFDAIFHDNLQDLLMVSYLSHLTKIQLLVAEKLNETLTLGV
jgi:translation initiation factor 3 subunit F